MPGGEEKKVESHGKRPWRRRRQAFFFFILQAGPDSKSRIFHPSCFDGRFRTPKNAVYMAEKRIFFCVA